MSYEPKPGDVIRYDFLWKDQELKGQAQGKDRPCAIVVATKPDDNGEKTIIVVPITHSPPDGEDHYAIQLPTKVAKYLGLDSDTSWIKTQQVNTFKWPAGGIPYGVQPVRQGQWTYGSLPDSLCRQIHDNVREQAQKRTIARTDR